MVGVKGVSQRPSIYWELAEFPMQTYRAPVTILSKPIEPLVVDSQGSIAPRVLINTQRPSIFAELGSGR